MTKNMTLIDNYWIPDGEVTDYLHKREELAHFLLEELSKQFPIVERAWKGSEDGEAVIALNDQEELEVAIHLDPGTISDFQASSDWKQTLKEYL